MHTHLSLFSFMLCILILLRCISGNLLQFGCFWQWLECRLRTKVLETSCYCSCASHRKTGRSYARVLFFHWFSSVLWIVLKNGCSYKAWMLLIILASIFIRSRTSSNLWCDILSKASSQSKKNNIMFWCPAFARSCNRRTQNRGSEVLLPLLNPNCVSLTNWSVASAIFFCNILVIILYDEFSKKNRMVVFRKLWVAFFTNRNHFCVGKIIRVRLFSPHLVQDSRQQPQVVFV